MSAGAASGVVLLWEVIPMTHRTTTACVFRALSLLTLGALASACNSGGDSPAAASGSVEAKADVSSSAKAPAPAQPARTEPAAQREARSTRGQAQADIAASPAQARTQRPGELPATPGAAQLDLAAAQLAEAGARLKAAAEGTSIEASTEPGTPSLKVNKGGQSVIDAKVQGGSPSLNVGQAGTLIDANVQAGKPSLNLGGLEAQAKASAGANTKNTK
jgi:hypothetical protein